VNRYGQYRAALEQRRQATARITEIGVSRLDIDRYEKAHWKRVIEECDVVIGSYSVLPLFVKNIMQQRHERGADAP